MWIQPRKSNEFTALVVQSLNGKPSVSALNACACLFEGRTVANYVNGLSIDIATDVDNGRKSLLLLSDFESSLPCKV